MVFQVAERRVTDTLKPLHDLLADSLDRLEALYDRGESITGVPTGYVDLDERLSGLQPSTLVIVGARPSMGKTALALGMAAHAAMEARVPVLYFSLEMSHSELTQRLLCSEARVDSDADPQRPAPRVRLAEDQPRHRPPRARRPSTSTTTPTSPSWRSGPRPAG